MANPERGQVALTVGDRTYTVVLDMNALCELEELLSTDARSVTAGEAILQAARGSFRHTRALIWAALRRFHPDVSVTDAGALIEAMGGPDQCLETIGKLRKASEPEGDGRPRKARQSKAGARTSSTLNGSGSVKTTSGG